MSLVTSSTAARAMLDAALATDGVLKTLTLKLFKNDAAVERDLELASLEEANFSGYAPAAVTFSASALDPDGTPVALSNLYMKIATDVDPFIGNTINGLYLVNAGGELVAAERFDEPVNIAEAGDYVEVVAKYRFGE